MAQNTKLDFTTPMINHSTGEELLSVKTEELKECGIAQYFPTGNILVDQKSHHTYEEALKENKDKISKYTLSVALSQLFDVTEMPQNSDFALYADTLKNIRLSEENNKEYVELTKGELDKLRKIFEKPPKDPRLNKIVAFVLECLDQAILNVMTAPEDTSQ